MNSSSPPATQKRVNLLLVAFLLLSLLVPLMPPRAASAHGSTPHALIDPRLEALLPNASEPLGVIVVFADDQAPDAADRLMLQSLGITKGLTFRTLPMAGVLATAAQVQALSERPDVRSLWLNAPLQYDNMEARELTGIEQLRTDSEMIRRNGGVPISGQDVTVLVNDSGVDGLHPDLQPNVRQNVQGTTNLNALSTLLPITYVENVPNTDIGGGHGTHVAGIVAGTGARSGGAYEGAAPGADLVAYGSGATLLLLDTLGGFDYALTHQFQYGIRVVTNSWGDTSDTGDFNPEHPTNIATKKLTDRGVVVVFSAGNAGPSAGTISGNFKKAPWVITVAAGDKQRGLADFSSRGVRDRTVVVEHQGQTYVSEDRPTLTAPGVSIISTRASGSALSPLSALDDVAGIPPANLPFYTIMSGTSMAAPHVAGIVALMLEVDPTLSPTQVKQILEETATCMAGYEPWEVGAGYVDAYNAVATILGLPLRDTGVPCDPAPDPTPTPPSSGGNVLRAPEGNGSTAVTWTGGPYTTATPDPALCVAGVNCDEFELVVDLPDGYWDTHEGGVTVEITWASSTDDFDLYVLDSEGNELATSAAGGTTSEQVELGKLEAGSYTVRVVAWLTAAATFDGAATLTATELSGEMSFPEDKDDIMDMLTVDYPLNVIFVGYHPTPEEVAELREWIPEQYQPTVANKSPGGDEIQNTGASLLNWNKNHLTTSDPYFLGIRYNYQIRIIQASDAYAQALFQVAEDHTAQAQSYHASSDGEDQARYNTLYGHYRVLAKGGDPTWAVLEPTKTDLIDAFAVEDWIFNSRHDWAGQCAFTDLETGECLDPSIIQPETDAYYDPYYDRDGLNLDRMPQGRNQGSSFFFLDTFSPSYANRYFRSNAYHTWGTDKVIDGQIIPAPVEEGGSWRITDPDTGDWDGVDYARTWGGRYRFHFVDLGAAPNNFESASWLRAERALSSDYPHGDPPIWQYLADPQWQQTGDECAADPQVLDYTGGTPCRMMPRLGRDVAYGLFFRSTAGYLYRPIPRGDVYWLAVSNWTDFYSRPQWVNGQLTNLPWYGTWWTNLRKLYKINQVGDNGDDVLRWLSSAMPYARWVGREGEVIPLYDPTNNQPTGEVLDTSPKYEDLPAPEYHVHQGATGLEIVPEPLYPGDDQPVIVQYGDAQVNLTELSNAMEKAKARGAVGLTYDDAVDYLYIRDYIDAHRPGIADIVPGVNTIPAVNMVFEKAYTWALPAIVGGIAAGTDDGEAWGVLNNVNDRFKWDESHYSATGCQVPQPCSMTDQSLPTQQTGTGFSYTIEHEAAHNLGLSHPHDGSYGVDRCPAGDPDAGEWKCYWSGLGWMYDISAAPTTYAMSYRPYEVEDQDNLQRGHVAEYLVGAQEALRNRLVDEAQAGRTRPSAAWQSDYARMQQWRAQAAALFRAGDYLHAEYAARNASLAARGYPQTAANTTNPRLVEAGQIFYFNVHPQTSEPPAQADLVVSDLLASQARPGQTILTATVLNQGEADASNVVVRFVANGTTLADSAPTTLASGASTELSFTWNTRGLNGSHLIAAIADPDNTIAEEDEGNNQGQREIRIRGNKVQNGSFEQSATGTTPDGWTGSAGTGYETSGAHASDGSRAVSGSGNGQAAALRNPTWTSAPIPVTPGESYELAMTVTTQGLSSAPRLNVELLNGSGGVLNTVTGIATTLTGTQPAQQLLSQLTIPAGVTQVRLKLLAFSPTDLATGGTVWFDDIWLR